MSGDALSLFLFLVSGAVACAVGALTAPKGWRAWTLWAATAGFSVASLVFLKRPVGFDMARAVQLVTALTPALTVSVVALRGFGRTPAPPKTSGKAESLSSPFTPDTPISYIAAYLAAASEWSGRFAATPTPDQVSRELIDKLHLGRVTAWGALSPDQPVKQIAREVWEHATLSAEKNMAIMRGPTYVRLQVAMGQVEGVWPPAQTSY